MDRQSACICNHSHSDEVFHWFFVITKIWVTENSPNANTACIYIIFSACTANCENPVEGGVFSPGEVVRTNNPCVSYVCRESESGCGHHEMVDEYRNCSTNITCDDSRYTAIINETASTDCCQVEYCSECRGYCLFINIMTVWWRLGVFPLHGNI